VGLVLLVTAAAAWYALSGRVATKPANPEPNPLSATASSVPANSTTVPVRPERSSVNNTAQQLSRLLKAATARGDLFYQQGRYENAIAEYKKGLALAAGNVALSTKIRHAVSAEQAEQRDGAWPASGDRPAKPYTKAELVDLLTNYAPPLRVADSARHRGIDFELTAASERDLRQAGAGDELISVLKPSAPQPSTGTAFHAGSDLDRAQELIKAGRFNQALAMIQRSALGGSPDGQRLMGDAYVQGWGVPKDYLRARQWYEKSAAAGNTLAMIRIGLLFEQGWGVPQDYLRAREWFEKSSAAGNPIAMVRIGDLYERGWGLPKDYTQALLWYEKSAARGNALAMLRLGNLYERGWGVPRDVRRARQWFEKSAAAGNVSARGRLDVLPN
jgi:TPR repeat protein